jgi:hydroxymethylpyrimidine pyrophosphatase-like HAD family hydrolase
MLYSRERHPGFAVMKIAVDMDNTLFDDFGQRMRPGIRELLLDLKEDGHELVLWTSSTRERATRILAEHRVVGLFAACLYREDYDPDNRGVVKDLRAIDADAIIDDDPKHVDFAASIGRIGILVASYRGRALQADDLARVRARLQPARSGWLRWLRDDRPR